MAVARDEDGRLVMVKRAGPGPGADRLRREATVLEHTTGRGCVELVAVADVPGGGVRLTTAWVGGGSLATALPLRPARVLVLARALAGTLADLHAAGVVHGRVAPDHVVLAEGDRPLLCGLADARLPDEDEGPTPAADVIALLALVADLVGDARGDLADGLRAVVAAGPAGGATAVAARLGALAPPPRRPTPSPPRDLRPRRTPPPRRRPPVRGLVVAGVSAVVLLGLTVTVVRGARGPEAAPVRPATTVTTRPPCPAASPTAVDLDGDGCGEAVAVRAGVVTAGERRWQVGEPDDLAAVGDWDCEGPATAAVVRPATGEVWVYDRWASADRPVTARPGPAAMGAVTAARRHRIRRLRPPRGHHRRRRPRASGPRLSGSGLQNGAAKCPVLQARTVATRCYWSGTRRRTATSLASNRPCTDRTRRSPSGTTRPSSSSRSSAARAPAGTPARVRMASWRASSRRSGGASSSPAASVGTPAATAAT